MRKQDSTAYSSHRWPIYHCKSFPQSGHCPLEWTIHDRLMVGGTSIPTLDRNPSSSNNLQRVFFFCVFAAFGELNILQRFVKTVVKKTADFHLFTSRERVLLSPIFQSILFLSLIQQNETVCWKSRKKTIKKQYVGRNFRSKPIDFICIFDILGMQIWFFRLSYIKKSVSRKTKNGKE